jgi:hypothetical protein
VAGICASCEILWQEASSIVGMNANHCRNSGCFLKNGEIARMAKQICFCFNYTADDILKDLEKNGRSTIMERIRAEKKKGGCQCAVFNPKGQ